MTILRLNQIGGSSDSVYEGITTIWLLSTLGNPSRLNSSLTTSSGNIKKKDLINVSIPKTCTAIEENELGLPLRHVSSLLYGVTLCYSRKTDYVLNDLTMLLTQLRKKLYTVRNLKKDVHSTALERTTILNLERTNLTTNAFLNDDPFFDIQQTNHFEDIFRIAPSQDTSEQLLIRKQDYIKELTNSDEVDKLANFMQGQPNLGRPITLDDIPIDTDFNLDIEDVMSRQGTALGFSADSVDSSTDLDLRYDDKEFTLNFEEGLQDGQGGTHAQLVKICDNTGINFGNVEDENDNTYSLADEKDEPSVKRLKLSNIDGSPYLTQIRTDERIGLSNNVLRSNHENYSETMEHPVKKSSKKYKMESIVLGLKNGNQLMCASWSSLFLDIERGSQKSADWSYRRSVERGRKRARSETSQSNSRSSSEEQGRRALISREQSFVNDGNLLLNLQQIDEDLEEDYPRDSFNFDRPDSFQLELPSSSFGRHETLSNSRSGSHASSSIKRDVVDELYRRTQRSRSENVQRQPTSDYSREDTSRTLLDPQTKKFYEYIKDRALLAGKATISNDLFSKKMLFEDLVPSKLSQNEEGQIPPLDKKIAANAFLSLLSLATKGLLALKEYDTSTDFQFKLLNGDDIVIYV